MHHKHVRPGTEDLNHQLSFKISVNHVQYLYLTLFLSHGNLPEKQMS